MSRPCPETPRRRNEASALLETHWQRFHPLFEARSQLSTAGRIEPSLDEVEPAHETQGAQGLEPVTLEKIEARAPWHVRSPGDIHDTRPRSERQGRKHSLGDQGSRARRRDLETELAGGQGSGLEPQIRRAIEDPSCVRPAGEGRCPDGRKMLRSQARHGALSPDLRDVEPLTRGERQRERRAKHLSPALPLGAVDGNEAHGVPGEGG